jgi:hypothetical protein
MEASPPNAKQKTGIDAIVFRCPGPDVPQPLELSLVIDPRTKPTTTRPLILQPGLKWAKELQNIPAAA